MVRRYLELVSLDEALRILKTSFPHNSAPFTLPVTDAAGMVTAKPIYAKRSIPPLHLSAMDGIAVRSEETTGAAEQRPKIISSVKRVNTGNVIPEGYDAVVMIEDTEESAGGWMIRAPASPWQHVRPVGEDIGESEMILAGHRRIRPHEIGALLSYGVETVATLSPSVGLIPTGSELVPAGVSPGPGQVLESNMQMSAAYCTSLGMRPRLYPIVPDDRLLIKEAILAAVRENDIVIISAGSSKGTCDYTADVIAECGEVLVHGVSIRPAKPVIIGRINEKPVIGMPGYPVACYTILREFVRPLSACYGLIPATEETIKARLATVVQSEIGTDDFVLLSAGKIHDRWVAVPQSRGSGVQMGMVRANAYTTVPASLEGLKAGAEVEAHLLVPQGEAGEALLATGSHDPSLDALANILQSERLDLHCTHTGSMGGILSLLRRDCHVAPMHLIAPDGGYNLPFLEKYIPGEEIALVCVAERQQGIVSREGIGLEEIPGHTFINRQQGSGTRMLLDRLMAEKEIDTSSIPGWDNQATTHLAVALSVKTGEADAGMCVYSAAKALGLPFVPVTTERYEIAAYQSDIESDRRISAVFEAVGSEEFIKELTRLGGYETKVTGEIRRTGES